MSDHPDARRKGMQLVEIKPAIISGDSADHRNKTRITRLQYFEMVRFWNRIISDFASRISDVRRYEVAE